MTIIKRLTLIVLLGFLGSGCGGGYETWKQKQDRKPYYDRGLTEPQKRARERGSGQGPFFWGDRDDDRPSH
jgi:hypothetical protein